MKKLVCLLVSIFLSIPILASGAVLTDESGFTDPTSGRYYSVRNITVRDRTGTELQGVVIMDDKGVLVAQFQAGGPGIINNAMQGAVAGFEQGLGIGLGMGLQKPANYSGGNSGSTSTGGMAKSSSKSSAKTYQSQNQGQSQIQVQKQNQNQSLKNTNLNSNYNSNNFKPSNVNTNLNTNIAEIGGGWIPPGQNK